MTLLHCVRQQRSAAKSSLEAEALFVTYDYMLYKFDSSWSRKTGRLACTILPSQLLQLLRPFVPATADFDQSFAATFAVPDFRAMGSNAHVAAARMLQMLAAYETLPERTASSILANDLILDGLERRKSDEEMHEFIESAIAAENATLAAEREALAAAVEKEKADKHAEIMAAEERIKEEVALSQVELRRAMEEAQGVASNLSIELRAERSRVEFLEKARLEKVEELSTTQERAVAAEDSTRMLADRLALLEDQEKQRMERKTFQLQILSCFIAAICIALIIEGALWFFGWPWLLMHPQSYGIRFATYVSIFGILLGLVIEKLRGFAFAGVVLGGILVIGQLLGGPRVPATGSAEPTKVSTEPRRGVPK
jgi:hypothetical protein